MSHPSNIVPALAAIEDLIANLVKVRSRVRADSDLESLTSFIDAVVGGTQKFVRAHESSGEEVTTCALEIVQSPRTQVEMTQ